MAGEVARLVEVMAQLRAECPWDRVQTHLSLVNYLIEETSETVEAIETGTPGDLCEELGDLLLQVVFHAQIAAESGEFTLDEVAAGVADKLISRHPYVFSDAEVPEDLRATWEQRKKVAKARDSALDGIPQRMSAVARAQKVIARSRSHGVGPSLDDRPITSTSLGQEILALVARANACGIDAEQAVRAQLRVLEEQIRGAEGTC